MSDLETHDVPEGVDAAGWTLDVRGRVERAVSLAPADLEALPAETVTDEFVCVEGWSAEGLSWRGVRMGDVLERAGPEGDHALVSALDGEYACSFSVDRLADALLAVGLDGEALPLEHGGPARLVPVGDGRDCWESVKWVSAVEITDAPPEDADTAASIALGRIGES